MAGKKKVSGQRTYRLDEKRGAAWDAALAEAGMKQQAGIETLVDALELRLITLNELRAETIRIRREREAKE